MVVSAGDRSITVPLHPDVTLSVHLDAICGRNQYTRDPAPVIEEIRAAAGGRILVRDDAVGCWVGFFRAAETTMLCDALLTAFPGAREHVATGAGRRGLAHSAAGYARS